MRRTRRRQGVRSKKSVRRYSKKRSRKSKRVLLSKKRKQRGGMMGAASGAPPSGSGGNAEGDQWDNILVEHHGRGKPAPYKDSRVEVVRAERVDGGGTWKGIRFTPNKTGWTGEVTVTPDNLQLVGHGNLVKNSQSEGRYVAKVKGKWSDGSNYMGGEGSNYHFIFTDKPNRNAFLFSVLDLMLNHSVNEGDEATEAGHGATKGFTIGNLAGDAGLEGA
jgi:hypothetical protein